MPLRRHLSANQPIACPSDATCRPTDQSPLAVVVGEAVLPQLEHDRPAPTGRPDRRHAVQKGSCKRSLDRDRSTAYLQGECSYRRAKEEDEILDSTSVEYLFSITPLPCRFSDGNTIASPRFRPR